jgi:hypothetical protein
MKRRGKKEEEQIHGKGEVRSGMGRFRGRKGRGRRWKNKKINVKAV